MEIQTSWGPLPHTPKTPVMLVFDQAEPFQCSSHGICRLLFPMAQTSLGPLPQNSNRSLAGSGRLAAFDQVEPFQCRTVLPKPPAQTSLGPLPQTLHRISVVPLGAMGDQTEPFQCRIRPA